MEQGTKILLLRLYRAGADPEIFKRGGPEAIIYRSLERGVPKSLKMAFECSFQSFSYKFLQIFHQRRGGGVGPLGPSPKSATVEAKIFTRDKSSQIEVRIGFAARDLQSTKTSPNTKA